MTVRTRQSHDLAITIQTSEYVKVTISQSQSKVAWRNYDVIKRMHSRCLKLNHDNLAFETTNAPKTKLFTAANAQLDGVSHQGRIGSATKLG